MDIQEPPNITSQLPKIHTSVDQEGDCMKGECSAARLRYRKKNHYILYLVGTPSVYISNKSLCISDIKTVFRKAWQQKMLDNGGAFGTSAIDMS